MIAIAREHGVIKTALLLYDLEMADTGNGELACMLALFGSDCLTFELPAPDSEPEPDADR